MSAKSPQSGLTAKGDHYKQIKDRATKALYLGGDSNHITPEDAVLKANEALRLVRDLAATLEVLAGVQKYEAKIRVPNEDTPSIL